MSDPSSAATDLTGTKIGEYEIVSRLGVGGMGIVYEGRQPLIGKRVAVKVLLPTLSADRELVERFISEARAVNEIGHRGIVDIFSFGQLPSGQHYFVMEYLNGQPFDRLIKDRAPLQPAEALLWIEEVCDALQQAHDAGIIHRDIKPSNLFLVEGGRGRRYVKLLDFGIAKLGVISGQATPQTRASMVIGTPDYMSPEQARAKSITAATDVYALGCVLFEMVTGRRPFKGESPVQTMFMHVEDAPPKASEFAPGLPPELDDLLLWTMEKDPAKRPPSAEELRAHLAAIRATLPEPTMPSFTPPPGTGQNPGVPTPSGKSPSGRTLPLPRFSTPSGRMVAASTPSGRTPAVSTPRPSAPAPILEATAISGAHRPSEQPTALRPSQPPVTTIEASEPVSAHTIVQPAIGPREDPALDEPLAIQKSKAPMIAVGAILGVLVLGGGFMLLRGDGKADPPTVEDVTVAPKPEDVALAVKPVEVKPVDRKPADTKPADTKPADTKPADTKPADTKPADTKPADTKPADTKPADTKPADTKPAETKPADTKPADTKPADTKPAETKPADTKPADTKPADTKPAQVKKPADTKPAESKPIATKTPEPKSGGGAFSAEAISGRIDKLEKKLAQKEAASGDPDRVLRQFIAQAKTDAAAASTDAKRKEVWKFLDEIQRQLGGR